MFKYAKIMLLALAAFLLLGFTITANAAKPDKPQLITSAPIIGHAFTCQFINQTDHEIHLSGVISIQDHDPVLFDPVGDISGGVMFKFSTSPDTQWKLANCALTWNGAPGDFKASICAYTYWDAVSDLLDCLELD